MNSEIGRIHTYHVMPQLPDSIRGLTRLASNWRFSWDREARDLFARIDPDLWDRSRHNPTSLLAEIDQGRVEEIAGDDSFLRCLAAVLDRLDEELESDFPRAPQFEEQPLVAYLCAEFGIAEAFPIYSGGLGILAGDHLKSASDLRLPMVAVGLFYREGYNVQRLASDGWQHEAYLEVNPFQLALESLRTAEGIPLMIQVDLPEGPCHARIWRARVGRTELLLLDTEVLENPPEHKRLTARLYGGDEHTRIRQEILLGIGGVRALRALGINPTVFHMNEGHSAFSILERAREAQEGLGLDFQAAFEYVRSSTVFTTHTPVPAGNDEFSPAMMEQYFPTAEQRCGLAAGEFLELGRRVADRGDPGRPFEMTILALSGSSGRNGVSKLHGEISRRMFKDVWPGTTDGEVPVSSVTNGVHLETWVGPEIGRVYARHLGEEWAARQADPALWEAVASIPDADLWQARRLARARLVRFARQRLLAHYNRLGARHRDLSALESTLDPNALTIGFARRFAPYKRAGLILRDLERLTRLLGDEQRPVQILFAGKAHPRNDAGKEDLRRVFQLCQRPELRTRLVFLEDYDLEVGRHLVQGCDVWLNTPRRPMEASGTSGMKAVLNGGLHLSIRDGWWAEAFSPELGWAIDPVNGSVHIDLEDVDRVEADNLYDLLENEIIPLFYHRSIADVPTDWMQRVKRSVSTLAPFFNTHRMVRQYSDELYLPAQRRGKILGADGGKVAAEFAAWLARTREAFEHLDIVSVHSNVPPSGHTVGATLEITALVRPGDLPEEDFEVQLYCGEVGVEEKVPDGSALAMERISRDEEGLCTYQARIPLERSGRFGYAVRVIPRHPLIENFADFRLIRWS